MWKCVFEVWCKALTLVIKKLFLKKETPKRKNWVKTLIVNLCDYMIPTHS